MSTFEEGLIPSALQKPSFSCCRFLFPCFFNKQLKKEQNTIDSPLNSTKSREISIQRPRKLSHSSTTETNFPAKNPEINEKPEKGINIFPDQKHPIENYPLNSLFCLETQDKKRQILVKITEKRFDVIKNKNPAISLQIPQDYKQKIPLPQVIEYVVSRMKSLFCLDFSNGIGEYTIPLIRQCEYLISGFNNLSKCQKTIENLKKTGIDHNIANMINFNDFEWDLKGKFDCLFLNPYTIFPDFCSKSLNSEKTMAFLYKLKKKTLGFVMVLHRNTDNIDNLIELLSFLAQRQTKAGFEIMKIYYNEKLKFIYIFQGDIANLTIEEEVDYLCKIFLEKCEKRRNFELDLGIKIHNMLNFLSKTLGNSRILYIFSKAQEKVTETCDLFDTFKKIIKKNRTFQKSTSFVSALSNFRGFKFLMNSGIPNNQFLIEDSNEPSFNERPYSLNEDFRRSEDEIIDKRSNSSDEYYLSEYSNNNTSNEDSNEGRKKTIENDRNNDDDFEIIQANTLTEPKLSIKMRPLSFNDEKEEYKKDSIQKKKTFEESEHIRDL